MQTFGKDCQKLSVSQRRKSAALLLKNDDGKNCWIMNAVTKTKIFSPCPLIMSARKTKITSLF